MDFSANLVLENNRARLRPLEIDDFEALKAVAFDEVLWRYTLTRGDDAVSLAAYIRQALEAREQGLRYPFVIIDRQTGTVTGSTSYYNEVEADPPGQRGSCWSTTRSISSSERAACP